MSSRGINKVIIVGNLGSDPEFRQLDGGNSAVTLSVATSDSWKDKNTGQSQEKTEWHRCVAFGRIAEICADYLKQGSKVYLEGSLRTRSYDKDGQKHYVTEIVFREMQMLDSKESAGASTEGNQQRRSSSSGRSTASNRTSGGGRSAPQHKQNFDNFDDDIPF